MVQFDPTAIPGTTSSARKKQRKIGTTNSFARIIYFHYNRQNFKKATAVKGARELDAVTFGVTRGLLEREITDLRCSKSMNAPAGNFSVTVMPTKNWKQYISPGDWVLIYLYDNAKDAGGFDVNNPPTSNMVMFGNIDRVARSKQRDEKTDKITVRYNISGRDFGKVFQQTSLWWDPFTAEGFLLQKNNGLLLKHGVQLKGTPDELVNSLLDVFIGATGADLSSTGLGDVSRTDSLEQWQLPQSLIGVFGGPAGFDIVPGAFGALGAISGSSDPYLDTILKRRFDTLPGFRYRSHLTPGGAGIWNALKENSNELVNDFFVDLFHKIDGSTVPAITLRSRPTSSGFEDTPGQLGGTTKNLQELALDESIIIEPWKIKFENLGNDEQSRFNMFWIDPIQSKNQQIKSYSNIDKGADGIKKPMAQIESIRRNGLKMFKKQIPFVYGPGVAPGLGVSHDLYRSFINLIYDLHAYNHLYETGSLTTIGIKNAELGKVVNIPPETIDDPSGLHNRLYYVEGYTHHWNFPGQWETEWNLTMGQWNNESYPFIDFIDEDDGEENADVKTISLVKTDVKRPGSDSGIVGGGIGGLANKIGF